VRPLLLFHASLVIDKAIKMLIKDCERVVSTFLILAICPAILLGQVVHPAEAALLAETQASILEPYAEPPRSQITPAPYITGVKAKFKLKRDTSVLCSGYSIVGNTDPCTMHTFPYNYIKNSVHLSNFKLIDTNLWCGAGFTCVFGGLGGPTSYFTCGIPGDTYTWVTACYDYLDGSNAAGEMIWYIRIPQYCPSYFFHSILRHSLNCKNADKVA
jgi:hypothetical protein